MKKVKILIPSYNSGKTIGKTLESLLNQTYSHFEIYVVDNCSQDNTQEVVNGFNHSKVHFISHSQNTGNYGNFDRCIKLADFDYTAIYHSDDIYDPNMVKSQVEILDRLPEVGGVFTEAQRIDENDLPLGRIKVPASLRFFALMKGYLTFDFVSITGAVIKYNCFLVCPTAMVRSSIYQNEIHITRPELFNTAADVDVWLRIAKNWKLAVILKPFIRYRISRFQHSFFINNKRVLRDDFITIVNHYKKYSNDLDVKRIKLIDLAVRFSSLKVQDRNYFRLRKIIAINLLDLRLFLAPRWGKYVLMFMMTILGDLKSK